MSSPQDGQAVRALCWIRRDLRLHDHAALTLATELADETAVVFVYDTVILDQLPDKADKRITFIHQSLEEVDEGLKEHGSRLLTVIGDPLAEIPRLAKSLGVRHVVASHDDDPYALSRDKAVKKKLASLEIEFHTVKDHVVFERQEVLSKAKEPFRVYTPYSKAWFEKLTPEEISEHKPGLNKLVSTRALPEDARGNRPCKDLGFSKSTLWLEPGTQGARRRLKDFVEVHLKQYADKRNYPGIDATSGLSVHLRHGTLSIRECFRAVRTHHSRGASKWERELVWREFYHMILANFPEVGQGKAFRPEYNSLNWPGDPDDFTVWCEGRTGYPLVDAAMRCLNETGWMHNRLRMVTAMFLTKDLLLDWRKGEAYFAEKLLDYELASNNGGWQWSASTGADGQPFFRIMNPVLQSLKFDPDGRFIKEWCPELKGLEGDFLHWPFDKNGDRTLETPADWPDPVVIHSEQRPKVLALFRKDE